MGLEHFVIFTFHSLYFQSHHTEAALQRCSWEKVLLCNFIEITLWHGCSPVNLLRIFRTPFYKNTSGWLLLTIFLLCKFHGFPYISMEWSKCILSTISTILESFIKTMFVSVIIIDFEKEWSEGWIKCTLIWAESGT